MVIEEPKILRTNTWWWNKEVHLSITEAVLTSTRMYLESLGFEINSVDNELNGVHPSGVTVKFIYRSSPGRSYKKLSVYKNGKRSNIKSIRRLASRD